jgi:hypothetical protein
MNIKGEKATALLSKSIDEKRFLLGQWDKSSHAAVSFLKIFNRNHLKVLLFFSAEEKSKTIRRRIISVCLAVQPIRRGNCEKYWNRSVSRCPVMRSGK